MSELHHYKDLLKTYNEQEALLAEKTKEEEELKKKYDHTMQRLMNTRKQRDVAEMNLKTKKLKLIQKLQEVSKTCQEAGVQNTRVQEVLRGIGVSREEAKNISEHHTDIAQGVANDLKQLDKNLQYETVQAEIQEYTRKTEISKELVAKYTEEFNQLTKFDPKSTDYQLPENMAEIMAEISKNEENHPKELSKLDAEIARVKKNLQTIAAKEKELTENLY